MNEMRVANIAFDAYFVISADRGSMRIIGAPLRVNGLYNSSISSKSSSDSAPMTTRSGRKKSSIAAPSFKNSGLEQTDILCSVCDCANSLTFAAVPTGTVDLSTISFGPFATAPIDSATLNTAVKSAPPSASDGVPTAIKTMRASPTAVFKSVVKLRRPLRTFDTTNSDKPGS